MGIAAQSAVQRPVTAEREAGLGMGGQGDMLQALWAQRGIAALSGLFLILAGPGQSVASGSPGDSAQQSCMLAGRLRGPCSGSSGGKQCREGSLSYVAVLTLSLPVVVGKEDDL